MKKLMNKKGFTLMEMLIVVAIIVILVAIAIPTFSSSLDDAKEAADDANMRGAKGIAVTMQLADGLEDGTYYYDAVNGKLVTEDDAETKQVEGYGKLGDNNGDVVVVTVTNGEISYAWDVAPTVE